MSRKLGIAIFLLVLLPKIGFTQSKTPEPKWQPGTFRGLIVGRSTESDMKKALGVPDTAPQIHTTSLIYRFSDKGDLKGTLEIRVRKPDHVIDSITENLHVAMPRTPAYKRFGMDYVLRHYSGADCAAKDGITPLYRDEKGNVEMIEYPAKGIALALDQFGYDIAAVMYLSTTPGTLKPPSCVGTKRRK